MATGGTPCRICGNDIPPGRLKAMPETEVCVPCSESIGGEFTLEVTTAASGKPGSLKKTGQTLEVKRKRKHVH